MVKTACRAKRKNLAGGALAGGTPNYDSVILPSAVGGALPGSARCHPGVRVKPGKTKFADSPIGNTR